MMVVADPRKPKVQIYVALTLWSRNATIEEGYVPVLFEYEVDLCACVCV